eukprot:CFRG4829T1
MILTIQVPSQKQEYKVELGGDMELALLKTILEMDSKVPYAHQRVYRGNIQLADDTRSLYGYGLKHSDRLSVLIPGEAPVHIQPWLVQKMDQNNPLTVFEHMRNNPYELAHLSQNNPQLGDAVKENDLALFTRLFNEITSHQEESATKQREMRVRLASNPNDIEAKSFVDEIERMKVVNENMNHAMEYHPEAFSAVHMLYIECVVNGHKVKAFVDSGAQMTIMNEECAKRCEINQLIDTRFSGTAKGVGTSKIVGRVHAVDVQLGGGFMACTISVLEGQSIEMLLGLDMLKRHQCSIDLKKNVLHVGTTGGEAPFLSENEIPKEIHSQPIEDPTKAGGTSTLQNESVRSRVDASASESKFDPAAITSLMEFGFERAKVIAVLEMTEGNVQLAANLLLAQ